VCAAEASNEMILESLDCTFGPVATMKAGRSQLVVDVFVGHEVFEELRGFIVKAMQFGTEATALEEAKNCFVGDLDGGLLAIWNWLSMDGIAVLVLKDEDILVATGGGHNKATGLV
jgi:hypothetical protein